MTKHALVTGANRGIGLEVVRGLLSAGYRVWLGSRTLDEGERAAGALEGDVTPLELDVADERSIAAARDALSDVKLSLLINNAGIALDGFDADVARRTLAVNFFGPLHLTDALLPQIEDGGGVVMVSSAMGTLDAASPPLRAKLLDAGLTREAVIALAEGFAPAVAEQKHEGLGWPSSAYRVSKITLNALTRVLARELRPRRVKVNAACPGWVRTRMGGPGANRSVEEGAASVLATALHAEESGGFYRDGHAIDW